MKANIKIVVIAVVATLMIAVSIFVNFRNSVKGKSAKLEFMVYDAAEKKDTLEKTVIVKEKEVVEVSNNKNITILEINEEGIKISRDVEKYKIISEAEKKAELYTEKVTETIKYGDTISINVDAHDPFGPAYEAPRYHRYIKVEKEK